MIKYELRCPEDHRFEAWFASSEAFESLSAAGHVTCPTCGVTAVTRAPMAPRIARGPIGRSETAAVERARVIEELIALRRKVEATSEHVGERFPEEARRIHAGDAPARPIHGDATPDEAVALAEEGIEVVRIPWVHTDS